MSKNELEIAFVTCAEKSKLTADDQFAAEELRQRGVRVQPWIWDQPLMLDSPIIVIRSPWDYVSKFSDFQSWLTSLAKSGHRVFNRPVDMHRNLSKSYLFDLTDAGVPTVECRAISSQADVDEFDWKAHAEWVLKPIISASSFRTYRVLGTDQQTIRAHTAEILSGGVALVQPFYQRVLSEGEWSLIYFNDGQSTIYSHALIKRPASGDFRVQAEYGGSVVPARPEPEMIQIGRQALVALSLGAWLYARVDLILSQQGPVVSEVELIEPELFFRVSKESPAVFADCLLKQIGG